MIMTKVYLCVLAKPVHMFADEFAVRSVYQIYCLQEPAVPEEL